MDISIIIPAYNEEDNVKILYNQLKKVLDTLKSSYEIIFVDDGSSDNTFLELSKIKDKKLKIIKFRKNFGQTAAMDAGFKLAEGKIFIAMDSDLQNDPRDIPRLLSKIEEGYDVVSGWRTKRKDNLSKVIFSKFANILRKSITGEKIHDSGCSLKAYKKECFDDLDLYGEMHRFIPALLQWKGFKIAEVKVAHHKRRYGKTKYNFVRLLKGFLDLLVVGFWQRYSARPIHLFGGIGVFLSLFGFVVNSYLAFRKIFFFESLSNRPLLLLGILLMILGIQFILFGVIADVLVKIYYKDTKNYSIEKIKCTR